MSPLRSSLVLLAILSAGNIPTIDARGGRTATRNTNSYTNPSPPSSGPNRAGHDEELNLMDLGESDLAEVQELAGAQAHPESEEARCRDPHSDHEHDDQSGTLECTPTTVLVAPSKQFNDGQFVFAEPQTQDTTHDEYQESMEVDFGGQPINCPDGIDWRGTLMTSTQSKYCAKWSSAIAASGMTECGACDDDGHCSTPAIAEVGSSTVGSSNYVCTKMVTAHPHAASKNVGILMQKRVRCRKHDDRLECATFKVGRCINVETDVWSNTWNNLLKNSTVEAQSFGVLAEKILEDEFNNNVTLRECEPADQDVAVRTLMLF
jgi:hypothetical protein